MTLLPNLRTLHFHTFDWQGFSILLSPSLKVVKCGRKTLGPILCTSILAMLLQKCPNVCSLELYPKNEAIYSDDDSEDEATSVYTFASLVSFNAIDSLESTSAVIQGSMLELLGSLPHLRSLTVRVVCRTTPENWDPSECDPLSREAFPKLTKVYLDLGTSEQVKRFWELVPLGLLKDVQVFIYERGEEIDLQFPEPVGDEGGGEEEDEVCIPINIFEYLAQLPLSGAFGLWNSVLVVNDPWSRMGTAWPNIECIFCNEQIMTLNEFVLLSSRAPKLRVVRCDFNIEESLVEARRQWQLQGIYPALREMIIREASLKECALDDDASLSDLAR
ncbi:hypothetical protein RhiJN_25343 [Ceratobasidium sp. AG-Ba]|nr:hypothetical protein RhiJN_25343 [Ceratobasidium sp. AG-Ba]